MATLKRLKSEDGRGSGHMLAGDARKGEDGVLVKRAILVHEGVHGSMDGPVPIAPENCHAIARNMNAHYAKMGNEYGGKIPLGAYIALLDQHATDSGDRVKGRVIGNFKAEIMDIPMVGKQKWVVTGDVAFLGDDAIARVNDGRIYHLSVGLDDINWMLGEVSSVIEPAAPGAMLLSKGKRSSEKQFRHAEHLIDTWFDEGDKKWYYEVGGYFDSAGSEAEATKNAKAKAEEMLAKQSNKRFSATPLVQPPTLAKNKTTGASMPKALLLKRLAAKKEQISSLKKLIGDSAESVRLAKEKQATATRLQAEGKVSVRLSGLMKAGKLTPAEYKKLDLKKLAAMPADSLEPMLSTMDGREPVIVPGQQGSRDAVDASDIRKEAGTAGFKRLKAEAEADVYKKLGRKSPAEKKRLAAGEQTKDLSVDHEVEARLSKKKLDAADGDGDDKKHLAAMEKCLEAGDVDGAKRCMADVKKLGLGGAYAGGDLVAEGLEKVLGEQQMAIDQLHVQLAKLNDALKLILAAEEVEEQEMAGEAEAAPGEEAPPGKEGEEKDLEKGKEGGEKAPPPKEGEEKAPPAKKEGEEKAPPEDKEKKKE